MIRRKPIRKMGRCLVIAVALFTISFVASAHKNLAFAETSYKIAHIGSLSGPAAPFGVPYMEGIKAYVKAWNARGGINGRKIDFKALDDETSAKNAVNVFRKLGADPTVTIISLGIPSNNVLAIKPLASEMKIPVISGGAVDRIGKPADPYLFKVAPGTDSFIKTLLRYAKAHNLKRMATLNASDAYGQSEQDFMVRFAPDYGVEVVAKESFGVADTNFTPQLVKIRRSKPDMVYSGATGTPGILIFKQYNQLGLKSRFASSQALFNRAFFKAVEKKDVEGVLIPTNYGTLAASIGGEITRMYKELTAALGREPMLFVTFGWDHGILAEYGIRNSDGTRAGIRAALDSIKNLPAINGVFNYTPDNHIGQDERGLQMAVYSGGKFILAK